MYAIVNIKGQQFKVEEGRWILTPLMDQKSGDPVEFDQVLLYKDDKSTLIGEPYLKNVKIKAKVVNSLKGKKVLIFKYKKRKDYRKKQGHRQNYTKVMIEHIEKA